MTISEFINKLEEAKLNFGDLEIYATNGVNFDNRNIRDFIRCKNDVAYIHIT